MKLELMQQMKWENMEMKAKALYRGMELVIYGYNELYADCYIKEIDRRQNLLLADIEVCLIADPA